MNSKNQSGVIQYFPAHPHEGAVGVPDGEEHANVIATGTSQVTGRPFNLIVAFEKERDDHGSMLGRAIAESSFHHFVDFNWDTSKGCPSFVEESPGDLVKREPEKIEDIKTYVGNLARWLAGRRDLINQQTFRFGLAKSMASPSQSHRPHREAKTRRSHLDHHLSSPITDRDDSQ